MQSDPLLDDVFAAITDSGAGHAFQQAARTELVIALTSQAIPMADLSPPALLHFARQ